MNPMARSLIAKANDNLETAKKFMDDQTQHDVVGYNLAQASELFLKALIAMRNLEIPDDEDSRDLDSLVELLEENNFAAISSHADIIDLTPYNSLNPHIKASERLDMQEYLGHVEDLKTLVKTQVF